MTKRSEGPGKRGNTGKSPKFNPEFYRKRPTQERLRFLFDCSPSGELIRKNLPSPMSRAKIGEIVAGGVCTDGYKQIHVDGIYYLAHHLVWVWHHGFWPENQLDHCDRDRLNNKIENLREVSRSCNTRNANTPRNNITGVKGVSFRKRDGDYSATIRLEDGRLRHLIQTKDLVEAVCYRLAAEQCLEWLTCDLNSPAYQFLKKEGILK